MTNTFENYSIIPGSNNNTPPEGWPEGMQAGLVNDSDRQAKAYERRTWADISGEDGGGNDLSSGGTGGNYTLTITQNFSAYHPGMNLTFRANHANTAASTLTVTTPSGTLAQVSLVRADGTATVDGDIKTGQWITAKYDATNTRFHLISGTTPAAGSIPGTRLVTATQYQIVDPDDYEVLFSLAGTTAAADILTPATPTDGFTFRVIATDLTNQCSVTLSSGQQAALESEGQKIGGNFFIDNLYQTFTLRWDGQDSVWTLQAGGRTAANRLYDQNGEIRGAMRPFVETSGTTLQDSDMGKVFKMTGTVTLPDISAAKIPLGASIRLVGTGGTLTANTTAGQTIDWSKGTGVTSLVLADRESITFRKESTTVWGVDSIDAPSVTGGAGGWELIAEQVYSTNQNFVELANIDDYATVYLEFEAVAGSVNSKNISLGDSTGIDPTGLTYEGQYGGFSTGDLQFGTLWYVATNTGGQAGAGQTMYGRLIFKGVGTTRMSFSGESGYQNSGCNSSGITDVQNPTYGNLNRIRLYAFGATPFIQSGTFKWYGLRRGV